MTFNNLYPQFSKTHFSNWKRTVVVLLSILFTAPIAAQSPNSSSTFRAKLEFSSVPQSFATQDTLILQLKVTLPKGWHINSAKPEDEFAIPTKLTWQGTGLQFGPSTFPPSKKQFIQILQKELDLYEETFTIETKAWKNPSKSNLTTKLPSDLKGTLEYQACSDQICLRPSSQIIEPFQNNANIKTSSIIKDNTPTANTQNSNETSSIIRFQGPWFLILLSLLVGGLLLNLTPCVYPLIAITVSLFGQQSDQRTSVRILRSILYVGGMILSFSTLGVLASLSGSLFGSFLQSSWAQLGIAGIFILLSLSSFGLYEIRLPSSWMGKAMSASNTGGALGSLLGGLFAGLLAAPCIGPFVLALIVHVAQENNIGTGIWMFATLALGMGLPYLILGIASGAVQKLPRSGNWMVDVKKMLAVLLLILANYYLRGFLTDSQYNLVLGSLLAYIALYLNPFAAFDSDQNASKAIHTLLKTIAFIILLIGAQYILQGLGVSSPTVSKSTTNSQHTILQWKPYSEKEFQQALRNKQPILIDFESKIWCAACREMEEKTYSQQPVHNAVKGYALFKVDVDKHPQANELQKQFSIRGIPTVIVYNSQGEQVQPIVGFVPPQEFISMLPNSDIL